MRDFASARHGSSITTIMCASFVYFFFFHLFIYYVCVFAMYTHHERRQKDDDRLWGQRIRANVASTFVNWVQSLWTGIRCTMNFRWSRNLQNAIDVSMKFDGKYFSLKWWEVWVVEIARENITKTQSFDCAQWLCAMHAIHLTMLLLVTVTRMILVIAVAAFWKSIS